MPMVDLINQYSMNKLKTVDEISKQHIVFNYTNNHFYAGVRNIE